MKILMVQGVEVLIFSSIPDSRPEIKGLMYKSRESVVCVSRCPRQHGVVLQPV